MKVKGFKYLAVEVTLLVMVSTLLVFAVLIAYSYIESRSLVLSDAEDDAQNLATSVARRMDQELKSVAAVVHSLSAVLEYVPVDQTTLLVLMRTMVEKERAVFGSAAAFEPYEFDPDMRAFAPYYCRDGDTLRYVQLGTERYDYLTKDWYRRPRELEAPVWTQPYFDEGGGDVIMTTYSCPLYKTNPHIQTKTFMGVITADVSVEWLSRELASIPVAQTGYCFLVSDTGIILAHPQSRLIMKESIFSLAQSRGDQRLQNAGRLMLTNKSGVVPVGNALAGKESFLAFARLGLNGWAVGAVFPRSELLAELSALHKSVAVIAVAAVVLLLVASLLVARSISSPLRRMANAVAKVSDGDLDVDLGSIRRRDEVGQLAQAFTRMTVDLKRHIAELTQTTAAKERIESELAVAAQIQQSMLPSVFPPYPDRREFDVYAVMNPAKEVGGDFYQFFMVDDRHLCIAIGDVAGKGVPAALFMAVTSALIQSYAAEGMAPDSILQRLNRQLCQGNDACLFVTVFCALLDVDRGELVYCNAGHNPPIRLTGDGRVEPLHEPGGPVAGLIDSASFSLDTLTLDPGDTIFAFTDGVTEAFNSSGELYTDARLEGQLGRLVETGPEELIRRIAESVRSFTGDRPPDDDMTMLAVQYKGPLH